MKRVIQLAKAKSFSKQEKQNIDNEVVIINAILL